MKLKLTNTSKWPTPFVKLIVRWLMTRQDFRKGAHTLTMRVRHTNRVRHGSACYWWTETTLACQRRVPRDKLKDRYYQYVWSMELDLQTSVEMLVRILAHEMRHLDPDNRGISRQGAEHDAEYAAWQAVVAWREWWPKVGRTRYRRQMRKKTPPEPKKRAQIERQAPSRGIYGASSTTPGKP